MTSPAATWREIYLGGSEESENAHFAELARTIVRVQRANAGSGPPLRAFHAKIVVGVTDAVVTFADDLPAEFAVGAFTPGARLDATVRLSNANGLLRPDTEADLRGAALKVRLPGGDVHDLLMTSYPVSHARDATQFVAIAEIGSRGRALAPLRMLRAFGLSETLRIIGNLRKAQRTSVSLAAESYWSRGAILWGTAGPVRVRLSPAEPVTARPDVPEDAPDRLSHDFAARLREAPVAFTLSLQKFVSEDRTPLENGAVEWRETDSPWIRVATVTIPAQDLHSDEGRQTQDEVDRASFNPWNAPADFRPLGNLNRSRRAAYAASAQEWQR